jgi:hypothetical protein
MSQISIDDYLNSWVLKRIDYELQVKGKAKINNDGWRKLRNCHLISYLNKLDNPFSFLFHLKYKHKRLFNQISCANKLYYVELEKRHYSFVIHKVKK